VLGRQLEDQAAAIPQGEQVGQEQEQPQVGALAIPISGHSVQSVWQFLPGQARQHPRVGAQNIALETDRPRRFQTLEATGLGLPNAAGKIDRPATGAVWELQQDPAVVDKLQAAPGQRGWGVPTRGAGLGLGAAGGGGSHWLLVGSEPLPEAVIGTGDCHAGSA
jgi:hypothetical protein